MKNRLYKFLAIIMLSIFVSACGNKESHKEDNGNSHNEEQNTEENDDHSEDEEVMLSQQQGEKNSSRSSYASTHTKSRNMFYFI